MGLRAGDVKAVPFALVNRVKNDTSFKVNVYTGASLGSDVDKLFAEAGILGKRLPFKLMRLCEKELITEIFICRPALISYSRVTSR